jgi:hypothetical protein
LAGDGFGHLEAPRRRLMENCAVVDAFAEKKTEQELRLFAHFLLSRVYVVFVTTQSWQSAYRLFNVLNARGIPLSNADLIKNALFEMLGEQAARRSDELEDRWLELEEELGLERIEAFFGHHRTSVVAAKARGSLHTEIRPLIEGHSGGPFGFLDSVILSARNYVRVIEEDLGDAAAVRALRSLRRVEYDEWIPPLLAYLNQPVAGMSQAEFVGLLEKITIQNWVRRLGRTARLTAYYQLISAIRAGRSADEVRQIFRQNARNSEFMDLLGGELYGKPFDGAVLLRLEESWQDESVTKTFNGSLTIEHVLPQALRDAYWQERFTKEEHGGWVHRLGNLALLCGRKNYKAQYYSFEQKKRIYSDRNEKVSFDLTKEICDQPEWDVKTIRERHERLLRKAAEIWTMA